ALRAWFQSLPARTRPLQPAIGGVFIGLLIIAAPQIMGVGYRFVDQALDGRMALTLLLSLCVLKLVATIVSYASGNAGGIFAPSLYIGAMAGGAVGTIVHRWYPIAAADAGAYALVGMGTLFAGIIRAPMTSVFMIFEITQDYQILVPLMVANLLSFLISRRFQPVPVYHALLQQDRIHLPSSAPQANLVPWTAGDVMSAEMATFSDTASVAEVWNRSRGGEAQAILIGTPDRLVACVDSQRLGGAIESGHASDPVGSLVADQPVVHVHPDHSSELVLERLARAHGLLPVVARDDAQRLVGIITIGHILGFIRRRGDDGETAMLG